jgi:hypothetical protein
MVRCAKGKAECKVVLFEIATLLQFLILGYEHSHIIRLETVFKDDGSLSGYAARF